MRIRATGLSVNYYHVQPLPLYLYSQLVRLPVHGMFDVILIAIIFLAA